MAEFLTTRGVSLKLEEIIKNAKLELYIITPYLKFSQPIFEQLKRVSNDIDFNVIYGKTELKPNENKLLNDLSCNIYFKDNLHAKCYVNEQFALVSSMNLHSFSEVNNYEMGILLDAKRDKQAYTDCLQEVELIKANSTQMRIQKQEEIQIRKYSREDFQSIWIDTLKSMFSNKKIDFIDNYLRISNFPIQNVDFETSYGIATFKINLPDKNCYEYKELYGFIINLTDYRVFWSGPYFDRIQLYWAKKKDFNTIKDELDYCNKGVQDLINIISKCNFK